MSVAAGLVLALASSAAISTGFFVQHRVTSGLPQLSLRRPLRSLLSLFGNLLWFGGFALGIAGWALYVGALALAPLSLVQACSAGGIGVLALLSGTRVGRERAGVALSIAGLVLLGASLAGGADSGSTGSLGAPFAWLVVSAAFAVAAAGPGARLLGPGAGLGAAAGVLYAAGDVGTKSAVHGGVRLSLVPAILAAHGLAFVALQLAFQRGAPLATAGVSTLLMNSLPILAGLAVFGESLPGGPLGALRVVAFALVVAGAAALATQRTPAPAEAFG